MDNPAYQEKFSQYTFAQKILRIVMDATQHERWKDFFYDVCHLSKQFNVATALKIVFTYVEVFLIWKMYFSYHNHGVFRNIRLEKKRWL